jgi:hypothetical protein
MAMSRPSRSKKTINAILPRPMAFPPATISPQARRSTPPVSAHPDRGAAHFGTVRFGFGGNAVSMAMPRNRSSARFSALSFLGSGGM